MMTKTYRTKGPAAWVAAAIVAALAAHAQAVPGTITKTDGTELSGDLTWFGATQEYDINIGSVNTKVSARLVAKVQTQKPADFDKAVNAVKTKQYAAAISPLKNIVGTYEMLGWDVPAARWLAEAYLNLNQAKDAIDMCDKVIRTNPEAKTSGELANIYWEALRRDGREAMLQRVLSEAVKTGGREVAAVAQLKRADMDRAKGDVKKALKDGYLRTAILFQDVKSVQPEALTKAAECFQQLGQQSYADKMRKELLEKYPESDEARKIRGGA
jgi:TolA-binding protein